MCALPLPTAFAPAEKSSRDEIIAQAKVFENHLLTRHVLDHVPQAVMILNGNRQIVLANAALLSMLGQSLDDLLGQRPGEALGCVHAGETLGGCGTTESCRHCGAVLSILAAQKGEATMGECTLRRGCDSPESQDIQDMDLRVFASPMEVDGQRFTIFTAHDIGHERRRRALERIFFHDILNTTGGLSGFAQLLCDSEQGHLAEHAKVVRDITSKLIDEITAQKDLLAAESAELRVYPALCGSKEFLQKIIQEHENHPAARGRTIKLDPGCEKVSLVTDAGLLRRVIGNMLKNALEASQPGETISAGCLHENGKLTFWVHNPQVIPHDDQLKIFSRSFSTKGPHRGLGTYGIRLLTTRYLQGEVGFSSTPEEGTRFFVTLPQMLK